MADEEHFYSASGEETDVEGVPWIKKFGREVLRRLGFVKYVDQNIVTDLKKPQVPIPKRIINVEPGNVTSMQQFIDRHRRRGPYNK